MLGFLEFQLLRELAGVTEKRKHDGASFVRSLENLRAAGYIDERGDLTPSGHAALQQENGSA